MQRLTLVANLIFPRFLLQVDHFSKYGLDESDEDDSSAAAAAAPKRDIKKLKTLELRSNPLAQKQTATTSHVGEKEGGPAHNKTTAQVTVHVEDREVMEVSSGEALSEIRRRGEVGAILSNDEVGREGLSPPAAQLARNKVWSWG